MPTGSCGIKIKLKQSDKTNTVKWKTVFSENEWQEKGLLSDKVRHWIENRDRKNPGGFTHLEDSGLEKLDIVSEFIIGGFLIGL